MAGGATTQSIEAGPVEQAVLQGFHGRCLPPASGPQPGENLLKTLEAKPVGVLTPSP